MDTATYDSDNNQKPEMELETQSLRDKAVTGFGWNLLGSFVRYGAGFLINIILARLLGPEPYGLVAIAMIVISIANLLVDSGLNAGLIQKKELEESDIHYVFSIQMILGVFIFLLIFFLSPAVGAIFNKPDVIPVINILSLTIVIQAASQTSLGLLKRRLRFKRIQQAQILSYLIGYLIVGVSLALSGKGVWTLVFAQLTQSAVNLVVVYLSARHSIKVNIKQSNGISQFGLKILGANIANWIISNLDSAVIGRYFGSSVLGLYNRSMSLAFTPVGIVVSASQPVLFSSSSRIQESMDSIRKTFLNVFTILAITLVPFSVFMSLTANDIVEVFYGPKWTQAGPIMAILALALPFYALMAIEGPILAGIGKPEKEFKIQWIVAVAAVLALVCAVQFSLPVVLWTVFGVYIFRFLLMTIIATKTIKIPGNEFGRALISSTVLTIVTSISVIILDLLFKGSPIAINLIFQFVSMVLFWFIFFYILIKRIIPQETIQFGYSLILSGKINFRNRGLKKQ